MFGVDSDLPSISQSETEEEQLVTSVRTAGGLCAAGVLATDCLSMSDTEVGTAGEVEIVGVELVTGVRTAGGISMADTMAV